MIATLTPVDVHVDAHVDTCALYWRAEVHSTCKRSSGVLPPSSARKFLCTELTLTCNLGSFSFGFVSLNGMGAGTHVIVTRRRVAAELL